MNFIKLKNNFICQDFKVLSEKVLYGKKFKNDFEGLLYHNTEMNNKKYFYQILPEKYRKDFFISHMHIKLHDKKEIPPHTDSGVKSCINFYINTNNEETQFFSIINNGDTTQITNQTDGYIFNRKMLMLEDYFIAQNNEVYLLDVSKPHAIVSKEMHINRNAITLQSTNYFFKDVYNMLLETNSI